ncbi:MAG: PEGA domain-containing protein, partial [Burkholderiaceae bacterium]|nr:PEGA domain-containing protein [Burkholderiaceae bacterium]
VPAQRASKEASSGTAAAAEVVSRNATGSASAPPAAAAIGLVRIAVSPWGQVEVDGVDMGTAPPLRQLTLSVGKHTVTLRNADFPSHRVVITVTPGRPINVKHKFGS